MLKTSNEVPGAVADQQSGGKTPVTIKKYANRRLYNTATSSYVTLDHLCQMVKHGEDFVVYDAKTGEDITRSVLTQIIFEEEGKGQNMLPIRFLRQLIRFYGDSLQAVVPGYLDVSMESFARNQEQMRSYMTEAFAGKNPFRQFEEMARQNFALFERTVRLFSPFGAGEGNAEGEAAEPAPPAKSEDDIVELKNQLNAMQKQLDDLARKKV
jgi:polyhydroxyalkanoate synthesis repressor PhaR